MHIRKREKTDNRYQRLQEQTLDRLQELSGEIWTDYNVHDPGVTIADYMNYALYELQYKFSLPFESYLGTSTRRFADNGFFPAKKVFAPSIVTDADYEQLILREIPEVETCIVTMEEHRYHIEVSLKTLVSDRTPEAVAEAITELYHRNRNLCEDLAGVHIVPRPTSRRKSYHTTDMPEYNPDSPERIPETAIRPDTAYASFQFDFPEAYGISQRGISSESSPEFHTQVLQLKAYLLIADLMLADAALQVQNTSELLRLAGTIPDGKLPWVEIPEVDRLVDRQQFTEHNKLHDDAFMQEQKARFMDVLDTIYGEDTSSFTHKYRNLEYRNEQRAELIRRLPDLNTNRFRSFDISDPVESMPAVKQMIAALLGYELEREIPVPELLDRVGLQLIGDEVFFEQYDIYLNINPIAGVFYNAIFNDEPQNVPLVKTDWDEAYLPELKRQILLLRRNALFEGFLLYGANPLNYQMLLMPETDRHVLLFNYPEKREWMIMGVFQSEKELITATNRFWSFIRYLNPERQLFYLVEHVLLRHAYEDEPEEDANLLSIVVSGRFRNDAEQKMLEELLRERLPAHLRVQVFRVQPDYLHAFEQVYFKWRQALADKHHSRIVHFSESLRAFFRVSDGFSKKI